MPAYLTKSQLVEKLATQSELAKKDVKNVLEALTDVGYKELKKAGVFVVPGFADRKSTRLNSSHVSESRMPSSA